MGMRQASSLAEYGAVGDFVSGNGRDEIAVKASGSVHVFDIGSLAAGTNTTVDLTGGSDGWHQPHP